MNIAFLGTGLLGYPMAECLLKKGYHVNVYNRTAEKALGLAQCGGEYFSSPAEAIEKSDCIVTVLSDHRAIDEVLFADNFISYQNKTLIQMGTIAPEESVHLQNKLLKHSGEYLECPVLGSRSEAVRGTLILMVGSTIEKYENWKSFLENFGPKPRHIGEVGQASALKLALNHLIAAHAISFSLSLGLIEKNNIDVPQFMEILRESSLYAPMFDKKLSKWQSRNFEGANFPVKHLLKDIDLVLQETKKCGLAQDSLLAMRGLFNKAVQQGDSQKDYSAVYNIISPVPL